MLQNLYVKNLALIDETEVEFGEGLNILTGETGAGKSILLGSVTLALGGKYNAQMLRNGAKSGLVELTFHIKEEKILKKLEALDIYPEDGYLTLSRRLLEGRSVSKINGETVNMSVIMPSRSLSRINDEAVTAARLKQVTSLLIDIHGQHDNQTLLHRKNHLTLLDLYGKEQTDPLKEKMASCYQEWKAVCKKVEQSSLDEESRRRELSLAEFEVNEIEEAALKEGEDELLEEQYRKMTDSRKLTEGVAEAYQYTAEDERGNASDYLSRAIRSLQEAASFDEKGSQLYDQIVEIDSLLNDFNRDLAEYAKSFEYSEEEFSEVESRLNEVNHLKAKYGNTVSDILAYCEEKRQRLSEMEDYDSFMQELLEKQKKAEKQMEKAAMELHEVREQNAVKFAEEIVHQMSELNFMDARFEIRLTEAKSYSAQGKDDAEFYLSVNPGEPVRPLGDVASGGELSRIMLAIKTVLADEEDTPTLIFDEIDSGISGITAGRVGERLQLIGKSRQVICITHLSQIAAAADIHFCIHKEAEDNSVRTQIERLDQEDSVAELARLLGGANVTDGIIDSAREMKELAKREK